MDVPLGHNAKRRDKIGTDVLILIVMDVPLGLDTKV